MKTLILMRHAKSDWTTALADHERPLNARGIRSARALGDWLRDQGLYPDEAIVSTARRTRETYGLLALDGPAEFDATLYEATPDQMLARLQQAAGETVLMVGHNPATGLLAHRLAMRPAKHTRWDDVPTGSTCVARLDIGAWSEAAPGMAEVAAFVTPRNLTDD